MSWSSFLWRNLSRNKVRSLLTGGAIALAVALVCFLATMPDGMNRILDQFSTNTRLVVHNEAGLVYPLPYAYLQKVRTMPAAGSANCFRVAIHCQKKLPNKPAGTPTIAIRW